MHKKGYVYIISSPNKSVLYTGVTSDLHKHIYEHKNKVHAESFAATYNCVVLVYYHIFDTIEQAILEEKRIKGGSRKSKEDLINGLNPSWKDLWDDITNS
jgi:putative endonuclease